LICEFRSVVEGLKMKVKTPLFISA
jgi:hypothetical protein